MTGKNGRLLHLLLQHAGIPIRDCYFTNTLKCCTYGTNLKEAHFKHCRDYLIREIRDLRPTVIISAGAKAMSWTTGQTGVSKLRRRGLPCSLPVGQDVLVFPIRQPAALFHVEGQEYRSLFDEMVSDLVWIKEQVEQGIVHRAGDIETDYQVARTPEEADRILTELEAADVLACDLETGDTDFNARLFPGKNCRVISAGFSTGIGHARAIPLHARGLTSALFWPDGFVENEIKPRLKRIFEEKEVYGHNFASFDQKWVRHEFGVENCNLNFDTLLGHYLLNEERGTHGLELLACLFTSMAPWKSTFTLQDTEKMCQYLCRDVDATWRLRQVFEPQLNELQQWLMRNILLPVSDVLMDVEYKGVQVSKEKLEVLDTYLTTRIDAAVATLRKSKSVQALQVSQGEQFNPGSTQQVATLFEDYLRIPCKKRTAADQYCVDGEVLESLSHVTEAASILRIRRLEKLYGTYCKGIREALDENGYIHTNYRAHGTVTGRLTSSDPNLQTIPRKDTAAKVLEDGSLIKSLFVPRQGYCLLQADYSQVELRVLACLAKDPMMLEIYRLGKDLHLETAAEVFGLSSEEVSSAQRTGAKRVNFGIPYGMSLDTLIQVFVKEGNTEEAAQRFLNGHRQKFSRVWQYMDKQERIVRSQRFQETPFGRRRRYQDITDDAVRQAYNYPIQSTASDLTLLSIIRCHKLLEASPYTARIVLTVHDSIIFEVKLEDFWPVCEIVKSAMESLRFDWLTVPLVADLEAGMDWGTLKTVNFSEKLIVA